MSTSKNPAERPHGISGHALVIGVGGLGCPAAWALALAGVPLLLCDDDQVEVTNLHRQILFSAADVGKKKLDVAARELRAIGAPDVRVFSGRFVPETAAALIEGAAVVVEGADNFATKFLAADACHLAGVPLVTGAAVRFHGTALLARGAGRPCYRCIFEDVPLGEDAPNCSVAGVMGPAVGFVGALLADLALDALRGDFSRAGAVLSFDGKTQRLRQTPVPARPGCPLCGPEPSIQDVEGARYFVGLGIPPSAAPSLC